MNQRFHIHFNPYGSMVDLECAPSAGELLFLSLLSIVHLIMQTSLSKTLPLPTFLCPGIIHSTLFIIDDMT